MAKSSFTGRFQDWLSEWNDAKTRQTLAVVLVVLIGLLIGMVFYTIAKYVMDQLFPFPPGLYLVEAEQKAELMKTVAAQVFIIIPTTWAVGTLVGGYFATLFGKVGQFPSWLTGILLTAYFWIDLLHLPNNMTLFILCPILTGVFAWAGGWFGMYMQAQKATKAQQAQI